MLSATRLQASRSLSRQLRAPTSRAFAVSARHGEVSSSSKPPASQTALVEEEPADLAQAPNRPEVWAKSQQPRSQAMTGPRFEQTDFDLQPTPYSAMELVHRKPVHWTHDKVVACDGGGGPHGHPRIFINTDKPEIAVCGYCGNPFANEHNRDHLESLPQTSYPLTHGASI